MSLSYSYEETKAAQDFEKRPHFQEWSTSHQKAFYDSLDEGTKQDLRDYFKDVSKQTSPDANVEAIRNKLLTRSQVGLEKYGVTTERTDLGLLQWLKHLQEELLDGAVYIEAALKQLKGK
jgi:hypothetical protein